MPEHPLLTNPIGVGDRARTLLRFLLPWLGFAVTNILLFSYLPFFFGEGHVPLKIASVSVRTHLKLLSSSENVVVYGDSWEPMARAVQVRVAQPDALLYDAVFFGEKFKFQYPPSSLLLFDPLHKSVGLNRAVVLCRLASFLITGALILFSSFLLVFVAARAGLVRGWSLEAIGLFCFGLLASCFFYPIVFATLIGQIQPWINTLFAVAVFFALLGKWRLVGVCCGIACAIKPQFLLFLLWFAIRRHYQALIGMAVTLGLIEGVALWQYGWDNHVNYLKVVSFLSRHGESYFPNQTMNGLMNRALFLGDNLNSMPHSFPPYHPAVYVITLLSTLLILALALRPLKPQSRIVPIYDFLLAGLAFTLASPIAWEHHYGICLTIFAVMLPSAVQAGRRAITCLAICYLAIANYISLPNQLASTHFNWLQSYMLFAALFLMYLLYKARESEPRQLAQSAAKL